jgi:hypothetical protein
MPHVAKDDSGTRRGRHQPEVAHYEVHRELHRIRAAGSPRRLDYALDPRSGFEHLLLTTNAIVKAAECWAIVRLPHASTRKSKDAGGSRTHFNRVAAGCLAVWLQRQEGNVLVRTEA